MKLCPNCKAELDDNAVFCTLCGAKLENNAQQQTPPNGYSAEVNYYAASDPTDHTAEFDPKDISDNKVFCMAVYLLGIIGVVVALLASSKSEYTLFHIRQYLKFIVVETLVGIATLLLVWTIIVPIVAAIFLLVLFVVRIICFFQICAGRAKEPAIISGIQFLK